MMKFIKKYAPGAIKETKITKYKNKILGIDFSFMIYKLVYAIRSNGYDLKNGNIIVTHIHTLLLQLMAYKKYDITPIFVFDNKFPIIKTAEIENRSNIKNEMIKKHSNKQNKESERIYYYVNSKIKSTEIAECIRLIKIFNYPVIKAKEEADSQLVYMQKHGLIDYIVSDDMDILPFGGNMLKKFSISDKKFIQEINLNKILKALDITHNEFIKICVLLGSDYCITTRMPMTAIFKQGLNTIILSDCEKKAVNYFKKPPVLKLKNIPKILDFDKNELKDYLIMFGFKKEYVDRI